jgi:hypothetical protein
MFYSDHLWVHTTYSHTARLSVIIGIPSRCNTSLFDVDILSLSLAFCGISRISSTGCLWWKQRAGTTPGTYHREILWTMRWAAAVNWARRLFSVETVVVESQTSSLYNVSKPQHHRCYLRLRLSPFFSCINCWDIIIIATYVIQVD